MARAQTRMLPDDVTHVHQHAEPTVPAPSTAEKVTAACHCCDHPDGCLSHQCEDCATATLAIPTRWDVATPIYDDQFYCAHIVKLYVNAEITPPYHPPRQLS